MKLKLLLLLKKLLLPIVHNIKATISSFIALHFLCYLVAWQFGLFELNFGDIRPLKELESELSELENELSNDLEEQLLPDFESQSKLELEQQKLEEAKVKLARAAKMKEVYFWFAGCAVLAGLLLLAYFASGGSAPAIDPTPPAPVESYFEVEDKFWRCKMTPPPEGFNKVVPMKVRAKWKWYREEEDE